MGPVFFLVICSALWLIFLKFRRTRHSLPPGPKAWPIIGNVLDMPKVRPWERYREWCNRYGSDVVFVQLPMQPMMIVGSVKAASDLFDKRSQIYSDRARCLMAELLKWDFLFTMTPYSARWRAHRKMFHQYFHQGVVDVYRPVQCQKVRESLAWMLESPEHTRTHIRHMITSIILLIAYGKQISSLNDRYVVMAQKAMDGLSKATLPGVHLVEYLPFLQYLPSWFPGNSSMKLVEDYLPSVVDMRSSMYVEVKEAVDNGTAVASLSATLIEEVRTKYGGTDQELIYDEIAMNIASALYSAASDSTIATAEIFLTAIALYPQVQKKAQAELDRVVGHSRFPTFDDLDNMPYIQAVLLETLRWMPVGPFGIPHASVTDDTYLGYYIPKGTMLIPNVWAMMKNPEDYPEPDVFKPERFIGADGQIDPSVRDPFHAAFGFGRRVCPGRHFAMNTLAIFIATMLHVFNITAGHDELGRPIVLSDEMCGETIAKPKDVPCGFKARSEATLGLIRGAAVRRKD